MVNSTAARHHAGHVFCLKLRQWAGAAGPAL